MERTENLLLESGFPVAPHWRLGSLLPDSDRILLEEIDEQMTLLR